MDNEPQNNKDTLITAFVVLLTTFFLYLLIP